MRQPFSQIEVLLVGSGPLPEIARSRPADDPRLRLLRAPFWQDTAARFNRAVACCTGTFTAVIGQHDQLSPTAVAEVAAAAATADVILSDDDAIDADDLRHSPRLGTAWDPDRVLAFGCPGLVLVRTALLRQAGGMWPTDGQEEWDLLLRAAAVPGTRIAHVPSILVSRRDPVRPHGTKLRHQAAARRYLNAAGHSGCNVQGARGILRAVYPLPVAHRTELVSIARSGSPGTLHKPWMAAMSENRESRRKKFRDSRTRPSSASPATLAGFLRVNDCARQRAGRRKRRWRQLQPEACLAG